MGRILLYALLLFMLPGGAWGNTANFFLERERGWFWYEPIPAPPEKTKEPKEKHGKSTPSLREDPQAVLRAYQKRLEDARALAVMDPTPENVRAYMVLQYEAMERAGRFADAWRRVVWTTPELDTTLSHPVSHVAQLAKRQIKRGERDQLMSMVAKTDGLFFFFKESCPYCQVQAPILRNFAARYGISIIPISLDGGTLPEFPNPRRDIGWAEALGVSVTPALFMVNPRTRQIVPLGYGVLTEDEIADRMQIVVMRRLGEI